MGDYIIHVGVTVSDPSHVESLVWALEEEVRSRTGVKGQVKDWDLWFEPVDHAATQGGAS